MADTAPIGNVAVPQDTPFLFGVTEDDISAALVRFKADNAAPDDTFVTGGTIDAYALILAQLTPPFECWKFGDLCEDTGPVAAEDVAATLWTELRAGADGATLRQVMADTADLASEAWEGEYSLTDSDHAKYEDLIASVSTTGTAPAQFLGQSNDERSPPAPSRDYIRSRSGVTNLVFYVGAWSNARWYQGGRNVRANVCVINGRGWVTDATGITSLPFPYTCGVQKKVRTGAHWIGTDPSSWTHPGGEGCAVHTTTYNVTACSCRP